MPVSADPVSPSPHIVHATFEEGLDGALSAAGPLAAEFLKARGFKARAGSCVVVPTATGMRAWFGLGPRCGYNPMTFRALPAALPRGVWRIDAEDGLATADIYLAWALGAYSFGRYKTTENRSETLLDSDGLSEADKRAVAQAAQAHALVRDMVNTPAQDMGPAEIEAAARKVATAHGAKISVTTGDDLLKANYPALHAVGRAAAAGREPRLIEMHWSPGKASRHLPLVALVGKGVTFDTGGLNLKPGAGMGLMKKDMGGAAHALALAGWVMEAQLPVRLLVLLPVAENAVSGAAFRPGDIVPSRSGISIEVGNTDAEGRVILADALTRAAEHDPALTLDFATLTGAARVALGPEVVPFYTDDDDIAARLTTASQARRDPVWRMPLWKGYKDALESDIAGIRNDPASWAQAGSVTAALFLQRFAPASGPWAHFDLYAWNPRGRPGYPTGAEAQTLRATFDLLKTL